MKRLIFHFMFYESMDGWTNERIDAYYDHHRLVLNYIQSKEETMEMNLKNNMDANTFNELIVRVAPT